MANGDVVVRPSDTLAAVAILLAELAKTMPDGTHADGVKKAQFMCEVESAEQIVKQTAADKAAAKALKDAGKVQEKLGAALARVAELEAAKA